MMMKKIFTILTVVLTVGLMNGQNLLDSAIVGYENASTNYKKAFVNDIWYGAFSDSAFYRTDEQVYAGVASLAFDVDAFEALTADKKLYFNTDPFPSASGLALDAGSYIVSYQLYLDASSSLKEIATKTESPALTTKWDVTNTPKGEWVKMKKLIKYDSSIGGKKYHLQVLLAGNAGVTGAQKFYIDDHRFEAYTMDTIEGNYLDHYYYGFEAGTEDVDGLFIPDTSDPYVSFSESVNDKPSENFYALKFNVPAGSGSNYSIQLGSKAALGQPGSAVVPAGDYIMSIKVYMDERNISQITTPFNENDATAESEWLNITWDIPEDIELGQWVSLKQKITLGMDYDTKVTIKADQAKLVDSTKNALFYVDDLAFVDAPVSAERAGNELGVNYYGAEGGSAIDGEGVFFQHDSYSVSSHNMTEYDNLFNFKFSVGDVTSLEADQAIQIGSGPDDPIASKITVSAGTYDMYIKLWAGKGAPSKINTNFAASGDFAYKGVTWNVPIGDDTAQWVELTQQVTFANDAPSTKMTIKITQGNLPVSGSSLLYIDDIALVESVATGIESNLAKAVKVYPNPANSYVNIETEAGSHINIYTLSGKMVRSINNAAALTRVSTVGMEKGIYLVTVKSDNGTVIEKLQVR